VVQISDIDELDAQMNKLCASVQSSLFSPIVTDSARATARAYPQPSRAR